MEPYPATPQTEPFLFSPPPLPKIFDTSKLHYTATHCNTLQHTATHCNTLQHTATQCNTMQHNATHYNSFDTTKEAEAATKFAPFSHCNTLQHTATTHCNALQHTATHCNTLRHPATVSTPPRRQRLQQNQLLILPTVDTELDKLLVYVVAVCCCSVLQFCCSLCLPASVETVAVCCSVLQCDQPQISPTVAPALDGGLVDVVAVCCCRVLQCAAMCCSVLIWGCFATQPGVLVD